MNEIRRKIIKLKQSNEFKEKMLLQLNAVEVENQLYFEEYNCLRLFIENSQKTRWAEIIDR